MECILYMEFNLADKVDYHESLSRCSFLILLKEQPESDWVSIGPRMYSQPEKTEGGVIQTHSLLQMTHVLLKKTAIVRHILAEGH